MVLAIKIIDAVGLGLYTSAGTHVYSVLVSRTKNDGIRGLLFILFVALFIVGGLIGCAAIADGVVRGVMTSKPSDENSRIAVFVFWMATFWAYAVMNWNVLKQRLGRPKDLP